MVFSAQPCLFQTRVYCPLNRFGVSSCVSSNIHKLMQEFLPHVHFNPVCHLRNQSGLGPEIPVAKVLGYDNQSNDFVTLVQVSCNWPKCGGAPSSWKNICIVSPEACPPKKRQFIRRKVQVIISSKMMFAMSKAVHWKLWQAFWTGIRYIS
jgi:hypothetical protein